MCRCGHDRDAHWHYNPLTYCGVCDCHFYRPRAPWYRRILRRFR